MMTGQRCECRVGLQGGPDPLVTRLLLVLALGFMIVVGWRCRGRDTPMMLVYARRGTLWALPSLLPRSCCGSFRPRPYLELSPL